MKRNDYALDFSWCHENFFTFTRIREVYIEAYKKNIVVRILQVENNFRTDGKRFYSSMNFSVFTQQRGQCICVCCHD